MANNNHNGMIFPLPRTSGLDTEPVPPINVDYGDGPVYQIDILNSLIWNINPNTIALQELARDRTVKINSFSYSENADPLDMRTTGSGIVVGRYGPYSLVMTNKHVTLNTVPGVGRLHRAYAPPHTGEFKRLYYSDLWDLALVYTSMDLDRIATFGVVVPVQGQHLLNFGFVNLQPIFEEGLYDRRQPRLIIHQEHFDANSIRRVNLAHDGPADLVYISLRGGASGSGIWDTNGYVVGVGFIGHQEVQRSAMIPLECAREFLHDCLRESLMRPGGPVPGDRHSIHGLLGPGWDFSEPEFEERFVARPIQQFYPDTYFSMA
ncbi:hypothetical protein EJ08DRAFT_414662 [Tothia fuscella]|uniref:Serine protease n=1 Tax=Tothia fuscella TaxID=1048955 RepID=A0A9P4NJT5_9PEZI|nr:hypothetical protein EJ08DRAFT_414662 [Tothia fuscella]